MGSASFLLPNLWFSGGHCQCSVNLGSGCGIKWAVVELCVRQGLLHLVQRTTAGGVCPAVKVLGPGDVGVSSVNTIS